MVYKNEKIRNEIQERTKDFSLNLIGALTGLPSTASNQILVKQAVRSGTSVGANYREACEAESGKDFVHKIRVCKKEAKETIYWLELLTNINPKFKDALNKLLIEVTEFVKIFSTISSKFND
ncbi:MAG: hypothetical protein US60_C0006G0042 [Microgenomates group bacterium GW2011_GWC1_37_8]|uniref:Four helix bundle protein n=1 Tax=Candidatus Woesebacteria bacterium GW2011_GWB1_38_8 TaxID=1618570 RepID=A0A0G0NGW9_9BACT|nr:MAG: hypothetical protein US60_C0006G0042 [Microgenomates group bacterium GW2011_GWC1_37_8]KKQ85114.1 MAG: hypothetical protein UT08_C0010G0041 [Candidatus Woesebacteria bacterium GW2011_GWB1_38_8]